MANWGFMGAGAVSRNFAESLRAVDGAVAWAVTSRARANAEAFAAQFGIGHTYTDYGAMLNDPQLDVVYIATPSALHASHAIAAIEAGKAVLVEKPFATSASEASRVIDAARAHKVFCMEGMWMRFIPAIVELKRLLDAGSIGEPRMLIAGLGFGIAYDPDSRFFSKAAGGGALLDLGVYPISLAHYLFGRPTHVDGQTTLTDSGVDVQAAAVLGFDGALAQLSCSFVNRMSNDGIVIGTEGSIEIRPPLFAPARLRLTRERPVRPASGSGGTRGRLAAIPGLVALKRRLTPMLRPLLKRARTIGKPYSGFGYQFEAQEVERCLAQGRLESAQMPLDETLAVLETIDAISRRGGHRGARESS